MITPTYSQGSDGNMQPRHKDDNNGEWMYTDDHKAVMAKERRIAFEAGYSAGHTGGPLDVEWHEFSRKEAQS